jgi:gamma-glutamylcyclotransferase (GGCT)/AIG2-like uncharacterized protein YtfP
MNKDQERLPVFVYGTLRPGQKNYTRYLQGRTIEEVPAICPGRLYFLDQGGYPYLLPEEGMVTGVLVKIRPEWYEETLVALDRLEEYDPEDEKHSVYLRRRTMVELEDGEQRQAWVYFWNRPEIVGREITGGDFVAEE